LSHGYTTTVDAQFDLLAATQTAIIEIQSNYGCTMTVEYRGDGSLPRLVEIYFDQVNYDPTVEVRDGKDIIQLTTTTQVAVVQLTSTTQVVEVRLKRQKCDSSSRSAIQAVGVRLRQKCDSSSRSAIQVVEVRLRQKCDSSSRSAIQVVEVRFK
jgi:hypothetical protein